MIKLNQDHINYLDQLHDDPQFNFYPLEIWLAFEFMGLTDEECKDIAEQYREYKNDQSSHSSKQT